MDYSKHFYTVKNNYDKGYWTKERVKLAVTNPKSNPWITKEEYFEITGEQYEDL